MKRLDSVENDTVQLEVIECDCGYHMGIDATFLIREGDFHAKCPACFRIINTAEVCPEYTDLETLLAIEVMDLNDNETTVGELLEQLTVEDKDRLCSKYNPEDVVLDWTKIDNKIADEEKLSNTERAYIVGAIYQKEYEGKEDPKYYQQTKFGLMEMDDETLVDKAHEVGIGNTRF